MNRRDSFLRLCILRGTFSNLLSSKSLTVKKSGVDRSENQEIHFNRKYVLDTPQEKHSNKWGLAIQKFSQVHCTDIKIKRKHYISPIITQLADFIYFDGLLKKAQFC